jgi:GntR family transcriptional regulator/MocR family aminotransferase
VRALREARRYVLRHPPGHLQRALALLIESGEYHRSLRRYRSKLMRKWTETCAAAQQHLPWPQPPYPPGGVSLWMTGPPELDCRILVPRAERAGVLIERGDVFFLAEDAPRNHFRIGFSAISQRAIEPGVRLLGEISRDMLGA